MTDLADLETFVAVADAGGVSGGARRLGLPKSIVSRRLARLETWRRKASCAACCASRRRCRSARRDSRR
jgi:hypothetical protein